MKLRIFLAANLALLMVAGSTQAADQTTKFYARSGSKMRMEGTSNIHNWRAESPFIGGSLEVGPGFPTEPGQAATPGKVDAKAEVFIMVKSLKSLNEDGTPYSDKMDDVMYTDMKADQDPRIVYRLSEMTLKEAAKDKDSPYVFEAKGDLAVAGVTNQITMPVKVQPLGGNKLKVSGTTTVKMTDFKIDPPAPKIALGMIKTGDEVKLIFDWIVAQRTPVATK